jgi:uncharacterized RDD family membrane protein YckC
MQCPSCNASYGDSDCCSECGTIVLDGENAGVEQNEFETASAVPSQSQISKKSTLIEFPGVVRNTVPEWRRELSERVREVQERRAREAAAEAAETERLRLAEPITAPAPQLELIPQATVPAMNPLVVAALRRIERANQNTAKASAPPIRATAAAVAYAREEELEKNPDDSLTNSALISDAEIAAVETKPTLEKTHNLVVVPPAEGPAPFRAESRATAKRLISDHDEALNYLDAIPTTLCLDEIDTQHAGLISRVSAAVMDLIVCGLLFSPFVAVVELTNGDWHRFRTVGLSVAVASLVLFLYQTFSTALTGRTLGMRVLSLRTIDKRTGLIPTGGQSAGRALIYTMSLAAAGLPMMHALFSREDYTLHDRLTGTVVVNA